MKATLENIQDLVTSRGFRPYQTENCWAWANAIGDVVKVQVIPGDERVEVRVLTKHGVQKYEIEFHYAVPFVVAKAMIAEVQSESRSVRVNS
jgi:hypothetical protein